jgi:hypothetical protein
LGALQPRALLIQTQLRTYIVDHEDRLMAEMTFLLHQAVSAGDARRAKTRARTSAK